MKNFRYFLFMLFLAPGLAFAQGPDSINVVVAGVTFPSYGAAFGPQFNETIGPLPLANAEPFEACDPITNPDDLNGNIAVISRGTCAFVTKVLNAQAAGAVAVVVYNHETGGDAFVVMGGECPDCTIPATFVRRSDGLQIVTEAEFGEQGTLVPIRVTAPPPVPTAGILNNGTVLTSIYSSGFLGDAPEADTTAGFMFNGENGLFIGSVLVGTMVDGNPVVVANPYDAFPEFTTVDEVTELTGPFDPPFEEFTTAYTTRFTATGEEPGTGLPLAVELTAYIGSDTPYVVYDVKVDNTSGADLLDVYTGIFADLDVGSFSTNEGGYDESTNLLFALDSTGTSTNYFGLAAIGGLPVSGWNLVVPDPGSDADLLNALTTEGTDVTDAQDLRTAIGVGPFNLATGGSTQATFALVAGTSEADIIANAQAAIDAVQMDIATEQTTPEGTYVLESAYPNPFTARTTIGFDLPTAQDVRLTVYDVLGREVAVLVDDARQAGAHKVEFDASSLPSGMYIYRLEAGSTQLMERVTLVR